MQVSVITSWTMKNWNPRKIRWLRRAAGLTQSEFADYLGVTRVHVTHMESGFRPAGPQTARLMEVLFNRLDTILRERREKHVAKFEALAKAVKSEMKSAAKPSSRKAGKR